MDPEAAKYFAKAIIILTMMASAIGEGMVIKSAFDAIGRNPELLNGLFGRMVIAVALVETTAIYAFLAFLLI